MPRPLFTPGKDPVPIVEEAGWAPGPVWTGAENLTPTGIRSSDCPARSQSLYRLRYPAQENQYYFLQFWKNLLMVLFALSSSFKLTDMHKNYLEISMLPFS